MKRMAKIPRSQKIDLGQIIGPGQITFRTCAPVLIRKMKVKTQGLRLFTGVTLGYSNLLVPRSYYCEKWEPSVSFVVFPQEVGVHLIGNASFARLQRKI